MGFSNTVSNVAGGLNATSILTLSDRNTGAPLTRRYAAVGACPNGHGPMEEMSPSKLMCPQCGYAFESRRPAKV